MHAGHDAVGHERDADEQPAGLVRQRPVHEEDQETQQHFVAEEHQQPDRELFRAGLEDLVPGLEGHVEDLAEGQDEAKAVDGELLELREEVYQPGSLEPTAASAR